MKSFLLKDKKPIIKWGMLPDEVYFEGKIPDGYGLAICPHNPYIILDIDKHNDINGLDNIPIKIYNELFKLHFFYKTKNNGYHVWLKYTGNKLLLNKTSGLGIDLRTNKGYVKWYLDNDIRNYIHLVKETSNELNDWLEKLFSNNDKIIKNEIKNKNNIYNMFINKLFFYIKLCKNFLLWK